MTKQDGNLNLKEKEWLETATKYVSSKHLPVLGKILKVVDDMSTILAVVLAAETTSAI